MDLLLFVEVLLIAILGIRHIIQLYRLERGGGKEKQPQLEKGGRILAFIGTIVSIVGPRALNVRNQYDDRSALIVVGVTTVGFGLFIVGLQLRIAAYKKREETPEWIKRMLALWE